MVTYKVTLTKEERESLMANTRQVSHTAKKVIQSLISLSTDQGVYNECRQTREQIFKVINTDIRTIDRVKKSFVMKGLDAVLGVATTSHIFEKM